MNGVPERQASFFEEMMAAGRGVFAILIGNKRAPAYFDFTNRGIVGSVLAVVVIIAISAFLPDFVTKPSEDSINIPVALVVLSDLVTLAAQFATVSILLRQIGRLDLFVPFVVTSNWWVFITMLLIVALVAAGVGFPASSPAVQYPWVIANLILVVNTGRVIMRLPIAQIALLVMAKSAGYLIGAFISLWLILPRELLEKIIADATAAAG